MQSGKTGLTGEERNRDEEAEGSIQVVDGGGVDPGWSLAFRVHGSRAKVDESRGLQSAV